MRSTPVIASLSLLALCCSLARPSSAGEEPPALFLWPAAAESGTPQGLSRDRVDYPLKVSANKRYLVDQRDRPFLMVGDAPQTMVANISLAEAATYIANRGEYGINALWINLLCNFAEACNKDATTFDGVAPFLRPGDLSRPNPEYFQRADDMLNLAAQYGMVVLLDPIETSSWLPVLRAAGSEAAFRYGQYLGRRYKDFPNIIWMHGNDFQSWRDNRDDGLVQAVARGIRSEDHAHIHTVELNFLTSGSLDDPTWAPLIDLDAAYTYFPTYAQVLTEYNRAEFKPVFMVEANYEFERDLDGSPESLRRQAYWTMLSGATGQIYASAYTWRFDRGWESHLDTAGAIQLALMKNVFAERRWFDLIPDQNHSLLVKGYDPASEYFGKLIAWIGSFQLPFDLASWLNRDAPWGRVSTNAFAPAARASDGSSAIIYLPSARTVTVDMSKLAGPVVARWYDPTSGHYSDFSESPLPNVGLRQFSPSLSNAAGDGDWVLVLDVAQRPDQ